MKKKLVIGGIVLILLIIIFNSVANNDQVKNAFEEGKKNATQTFSPTPTTISTEEVKTDATQNFSPTPTTTSTKKEAILSGGKDETGKVIVQDINIWMKPGSGGVDNVTIGTVLDNTKVEVLESTTAEGVIFYHIKSSVGKVSVLPTDFEARKKAMATRPQSEWTVEADPSFPVDGWVTSDFVTNLK